jgi:hypothetical protein
MLINVTLSSLLASMIHDVICDSNTSGAQSCHRPVIHAWMHDHVKGTEEVGVLAIDVQDQLTVGTALAVTVPLPAHVVHHIPLLLVLAEMLGVCLDSGDAVPSP